MDSQTVVQASESLSWVLPAELLLLLLLAVAHSTQATETQPVKQAEEQHHDQHQHQRCVRVLVRGVDRAEELPAPREN